jgi:hypothetical protein
MHEDIKKLRLLIDDSIDDLRRIKEIFFNFAIIIVLTVICSIFNII